MTTLLTGGRTSRREVLDDDVDLARDRVLVTRAQGGDRSAFDDLYMRYYRRLYRFCLRRLHDAHEAEDVAQEAFARAWRALPSFGGDRRFYPWLSVIASHLCTDVLRRRNRSTPVAEFHQANVASTEDGGEELMLAAVDSDLVAKAFTRLSDRHQRILHLREGSGWSYQRIADHEGVGITAVETLLWRARQALKREFANLAGSEGRMGAWIGAALSATALRRFLRLPSRMFRRFATTGAKGAVVAAGSAVAAAAMAIGVAMSSAPAASGPSGTGTFAHGQAPATALLPLITSGAAGSSSAGGAANGSSTTSSAPDTSGGSGLSGLAGGSGDALQGTLENPASTLLKVGETVSSAGNALGSTVAGAASDLTGTVESAAQQVTTAVNETVAGLLGGSSGSTDLLGTSATSDGSTSSASTSTSDSPSDPLTDVDNTVDNTVGKLLGGL